MVKIFIDDERFPVDDAFFDHVFRSAEDAIDSVHGKTVTYISFDHDLGAGKLTGYDFAKWLVNEDSAAPYSKLSDDFEYYVHSQNPVGAENIRSLLNNYLAVRRTWSNETKEDRSQDQ